MFGLHILGAEVDVRAAVRQRLVIVGKTEEQLRNALNEKKISMCPARGLSQIPLTMPPVADDPAAKRVQCCVRAGCAVPLKTG